MGKRYPWGDTLTHDEANFKGTGKSDDWNRTSSVGGFPPNGYGLYDMSGNVHEWCADPYDPKFYSRSPAKNPYAAGNGKVRVVRGGSWWNEYKISFYSLRTSFRQGKPATAKHDDVGFRCVADR